MDWRGAVMMCNCLIGGNIAVVYCRSGNFLTVDDYNMDKHLERS